MLDGSDQTLARSLAASHARQSPRIPFGGRVGGGGGGGAVGLAGTARAGGRPGALPDDDEEANPLPAAAIAPQRASAARAASPAGDSCC